MAWQHTIAATMNNSDLCWMSAADLAAAIARKKVSPVEVVDAVLSRIDTLKELNAYVTLDADRARQAAKGARPWSGRRTSRKRS
jgi:Asp-tRNA(Asn)/Glu-tRNA(Gln) amidotransferase A subunit family amidase